MQQAWLVYSDCFRNAAHENLAQSHCDWESLIDNLVVSGLVIQALIKSTSPKRVTKGAVTTEGRTVALAHSLSDVVAAVSNAGAKEACGFAASVFEAERKKRGRQARKWDQPDLAPTRGFNGDGLDGVEERMIGGERRPRADSPSEAR